MSKILRFIRECLNKSKRCSPHIVEGYEEGGKDEKGRYIFHKCTKCGDIIKAEYYVPRKLTTQDDI